MLTMKAKLTIAALTVSLLSSFAAYSYDINIGVSGNVVTPPCIINSGQTIVVDFGDSIVTSKIDGVKYIKTLSYSLVCDGRPSDSMKMKVLGEPTSFDGKLLKTSSHNLGIRMIMDERPFPLNEWVNFYYTKQPILQAVPVKNNGGEIAGGIFTAGATLLVAYQ